MTFQYNPKLKKLIPTKAAFQKISEWILPKMKKERWLWDVKVDNPLEKEKKKKSRRNSNRRKNIF